MPATGGVTNVAPGGEPAGFGWRVTENTVDVCKQGLTTSGGTITGSANDGTQYLDLVGLGSTGAIAQDVKVVPGASYDVTFAYGNNPATLSQPPRSASAKVTVSDCAGEIASQVVSHDTSTLSELDWRTSRLSFRARADVVTLSFVTTMGSGNGGIFLDAVALTPQP
jgi:hypothetical protein